MSYQAQLGLFSNLSGSCRFVTKDASIVASVNGPYEAEARREATDRASLSVACSWAEPSHERFIKDTLSSLLLLDRFPRCSLDIRLDLEVASGAVLAVAFNAAFTACLDAGLPLRSTAVAVSIIPTASSLDNQTTAASICAVVDQTTDRIAGLLVENGPLAGGADRHALTSALKASRAVQHDVASTIRSAMVNKYAPMTQS